MRMEVAVMLPVESLVPVTDKDCPSSRSETVPVTVSCMLVSELTFTVAVPCDVVKVKMSPSILVRVPMAPWRCPKLLIWHPSAASRGWRCLTRALRLDLDRYRRNITAGIRVSHYE
jgi:hypothetical protein